MKITTVSVYQVDLPLKEGRYHWSGGKSVSELDSTIVSIETDNGLTGWGEVCPLGPFHQPGFAQGVRTGIYELEPVLIGANPIELNKLNLNMDIALAGHAYVKSAIDIACWDILGKQFGQPCCELMGGRFGSEVELIKTISLGSTDETITAVEESHKTGYRKFHLNIDSGSDDVELISKTSELLKGGETIIIDANASLVSAQAIQLLQQLDQKQLSIENLASTYAQNKLIRSKWAGPMILDEAIDSLSALLSAYQEQSLDTLTLKISKFGGLTRAKQIRDLAVELGISLIITDTWGSEITTAAISHLAQSTPPQNRIGAMEYSEQLVKSTAKGTSVSDGELSASTEPGTGIIPDLDVLGEPLYTLQ